MSLVVAQPVPELPKGIENLYPTALEELRGKSPSTNAVSRILPYLVSKCNTSAAEPLIRAHEMRIKVDQNSSPYTAELFALLNHPDLDLATSRRWTKSILDRDAKQAALPEQTVDNLAFAFKTIGSYTFSFPIWRFLAQRLTLPDGTIIPSLLEQAEFVRLTRKSDTQNRNGIEHTGDWLGTGYFILVNSRNPDQRISMHITGSEIRDLYVEYRRDYLIVADLINGGAALIRNSSHFFGRDRLKEVAYLSADQFSVDELFSLTEIELDEQQRFHPVPSHALFGGSADEISQNASRLRTLLEQLNCFERGLSNWFVDSPDGRRLLVSNLTDRLAAAKDDPECLKNVPLLGLINQGLPPWFPSSVLKLDKDLPKREVALLVDKFLSCRRPEDQKIVLMSGEEGDFPVTGKSLISQ